MTAQRMADDLVKEAEAEAGPDPSRRGPPGGTEEGWTPSRPGGGGGEGPRWPTLEEGPL